MLVVMHGHLQLSDEQTIKAQVRLQFKDVSGDQVMVIRSQQATRKGKSVSVKTVDTAMKRKNRHTKEAAAIDSRCADINAEVGD